MRIFRIALAAFLVAGSGLAAGYDTTNLDTSVAACTDFNQYANGGLYKKNPIPAAYSNWGVANVLSEQNREKLRDILEAAAKSDAKPGTNDRKIADYYTSCMNEALAEERGLKPLQPELERIAAVEDVAGLQAEIAHLRASRSEERRVGKECRSRWSPYH